VPSITLVPPRTSVVVQAAGQLHGEVVEALLGVPEHVLDDAAALDPGDDVLDGHADARNEPVRGLVLRRERAAARLLLGLVDRGSGHLMPLVGAVAVKRGPFREARALLVAELFVVLLALVDRPQVLDLPVLQAADEAVLHRVAFFLPL